VVTDFDFTLGKDHLRGSGWRGLIALGFALTIRRGAVVAILALLVKPANAWLSHFSQLFQRLFGA
jgi:hypothetical protein